MKILLVGADGQLGREIRDKGLIKGLDLVPLDLPEFDISDPIQVENQVFRSKPSLVINASAYTAVDRAETDPRAWTVNRDGVRNLAEACSRAETPSRLRSAFSHLGENRTPAASLRLGAEARRLPSCCSRNRRLRWRPATSRLSAASAFCTGSRGLRFAPFATIVPSPLVLRAASAARARTSARSSSKALKFKWQ